MKIVAEFLAVLAQIFAAPAAAPQEQILAMPESFPEDFREDAQLMVAGIIKEVPGIHFDAASKIICQFAIESGYGKSHLAVDLCNFAGMTWRSYHGTLLPGAESRMVITSDGRHEYCQFADVESFARHYVLRLDRGPYKDWRELVRTGDVSFLKAWAEDPHYLAKIEAKWKVHFGH